MKFSRFVALITILSFSLGAYVLQAQTKKHVRRKAAAPTAASDQRRKSRKDRDLRHRPEAAFRHRFLSTRSGPAMGLHRQYQRRGPLSVSQRRHESERSATSGRS